MLFVVHLTSRPPGWSHDGRPDISRDGVNSLRIRLLVSYELGKNQDTHEEAYVWLVISMGTHNLHF